MLPGLEESKNEQEETEEVEETILPGFEETKNEHNFSNVNYNLNNSYNSSCWDK